MHSYDARLPDPDRQPEFYADIPVKRLVAWLIDVALVAVLCLLVLPFTAFTGIFFFPFLMLAVGLAYRTLTIAGRSATWGMRLMAIELRDRRGERLDGGQALLHTAGYTISIAVPLLQVISVVLMLTGARRQGLTDLVLGTVMLNRRA